MDNIYARRERIDGMDVYSQIRMPALFHGNCMLPSTAIVRRSMIEALGGFRQITVEDCEAHLRWALGSDIAYLDRPLIAYLVGRPGQFTSPQKLMGLVRRDKEIREEFLREHPEFARQNPQVVNMVFSELNARLALFHNLNGDYAAARACLREASALAPLKGKYARLGQIYRLPDFMIRLLFKMRSLLKKAKP